MRNYASGILKNVHSPREESRLGSKTNPLIISGPARKSYNSANFRWKSLILNTSFVGEGNCNSSSEMQILSLLPSFFQSISFAIDNGCGYGAAL